MKIEIVKQIKLEITAELESVCFKTLINKKI
jgi:hypothetical protein